MIPLTVPLEPVDFWVLGEAAAMADRNAADFLTEEALDLAHRIIATTAVRDVEFSQDRRADAARVIEAFRGSPKRYGLLSEFEPSKRYGN